MRRNLSKFSRLCSLAALVATLGVAVVPAIVTPAVVPAQAAQTDSTKATIARLKQSQQRWIEVNLTTQRVIAWEGNRWVDAMIVSTGKKSTPTVTGVFDVYVKYRRARMQGADYDITNVPHVMYFHRGYGFHGAFWHNRFGTPVSHGCINLALDKAEWLFNFASVGTPVVVHY